MSANEAYFKALHAVPVPDEPDTRTNEPEGAPEGVSGVQEAARTPSGRTSALALEADILGRFRADLRRAGVAGEEGLAQLTYLALTSRLLPWGKPGERPVSLLARGTSSTGKSFTIGTVLRFVPEEAWIDLGSMSRRYLFYAEEDLAHRFIVVPEWASVKDDDEIVALLRVLLSEGRIVHGTVEGEGKRTARRIEKEGPTGLLMTTTEAGVDPELETRVLSVTTDDTPEQTRRVFAAIAGLEDDADPIDVEPWHDLQRWLAEWGEYRVAIPFVDALADLMPTVATRLRRDFVSLLSLVRAHAILYQAQRDRDERGRIVAELDDYAAVRALVSDVIGEAVEASVGDRYPAEITPADVREWVGANAAMRPASLRLYLFVLQHALDFAGVEPNPARDRSVKLPREEKAVLEPPSGHDVAAILATVPPRWQLPLRVLAETGMRVGEAHELEWRDVDILSSRFRIRNGKTRAARRWVAVPEAVMEAVAETCPPDDRTAERRVFPGFAPDVALRVMSRACKAAGIAHYTPHDLRHRFASVKVAAGVPVTELAAHLGHSKKSLTLDVYSHVLLDERG